MLQARSCCNCNIRRTSRYAGIAVRFCGIVMHDFCSSRNMATNGAMTVADGSNLRQLPRPFDAGLGRYDGPGPCSWQASSIHEQDAIQAATAGLRLATYLR
jgi:hypothetical protein